MDPQSGVPLSTRPLYSHTQPSSTSEAFHEINDVLRMGDSKDLDKANSPAEVLQLRIHQLQQADRVLEIQHRRLESQVEAIHTEMESLQRIIERNIANSFRLMNHDGQTLPTAADQSSESNLPDPNVHHESSLGATRARLCSLTSSLADFDLEMGYLEMTRLQLANIVSGMFNMLSNLAPQAGPSLGDIDVVESKQDFDARVKDALKRPHVTAPKTPDAAAPTNQHNDQSLRQTEILEDIGLNYASRRHSVSDLTEFNDNSSIASLADSLFSIFTGSTISSVVDSTDAGERLVTLFMNDDSLSVLFQEALAHITPDRFERNLRRLLKRFAVELRKEAANSQQQSAANFVRYWARNSAHIIRNSLSSPKEANKRADEVMFEAEVRAEGTVDMESDESGEDSDPESDSEELMNLQQLERFITTSQAFARFIENLRAFIYPIGPLDDSEKTDLKDNAKNINELKDKPSSDLEKQKENGTADLASNLLERELGTEQLQDLPDGRPLSDRNILIAPNNEVASQGTWHYSTFATKVQRLLEPRIPKAQTRVRWKCKCGKSLYDDFIEIRPGAARSLEASLNQRPGNGESRHRSRESPFLASLNGLMTAILSKLKRPFIRSDQGLPLQHIPPVLGAQQPVVTPSQPPEAVFLLICHNVSIYDKKLLQLSVSDVSSDETLFRALNKHYRSKLSTWTSLLSFRTLVGIKFVKFELYRKSQSVDVLLKNDMPPPENPDYRYVPVPIDLIPPVGEEMLMHLFNNPDCAEDVPACLERFPKKLRSKLVCGEKAIAAGWGLQLVEGVSKSKAMVTYLGVVFVASVWGILWTVLGHDISGAWTVSTYIVGVAVPLVTVMQQLA
ncbi:hypothetical protein BKA61DRAFT_620717 [Leptodontidium sp. MPI-SDFR-AT-0119]|nr:hypothetical protein BKA61DRAFT_620717 [Leptodontidium sp. MPI-SDFR-AT-0119]